MWIFEKIITGKDVSNNQIYTVHGIAKGYGGKSNIGCNQIKQNQRKQWVIVK